MLEGTFEILEMGDDVELEEIFDTDLLSGSEDEAAAHEEEALLGVDAVLEKFIFSPFYVISPSR